MQGWIPAVDERVIDSLFHASPLSKTVRFNVLKIQKKAKDSGAKQFAKF
jgi:hypothetical protein